VAKAPWYFLGLQELLSYFNPTVAGVLVIPVYIGGLLIIPYVDRTPYKAARDRKMIWVFFLCLMVGGLIITFIGSFFRGPGWNWVWPWDGLYFNL
jgi:quinol-cytochrome oxidoreductase complex cytochrome b subunit